MGKLTALKVKKLTKPGRYADGDGLYLWVRKSGNQSWLLRVQHLGKRYDLSLGSVKSTTLAEARRAAFLRREDIRRGLNPYDEKKRLGRIPTFETAALQVISERQPAWKNPKTAAQWLHSLETYAFPTIGHITVNEITSSEIRELLLPIWLEKEETARRVKQRVGTILDWAFSMGYRDTEAPMRAISKGLPTQTFNRNHFKALEYGHAPAFMKTLVDAPPTAGRQALQFAILTGARSGEVRKMSWPEIDFEEELWSIPAQRMKTGSDHFVPLSTPALAILQERARSRTVNSFYVFEGIKTGKPVSQMTMLKVLRDMGLEETVHGFRSTFRDWTAETTNTPHYVAEKALAHKIKNQSEAAYRRGDLLEKRRKLMSDWATYLFSENTISHPSITSQYGRDIDRAKETGQQ